jgi:hypothetical protein
MQSQSNNPHPRPVNDKYFVEQLMVRNGPPAPREPKPSGLFGRYDPQPITERTVGGRKGV